MASSTSPATIMRYADYVDRTGTDPLGDGYPSSSFVLVDVTSNDADEYVEDGLLGWSPSRGEVEALARIADRHLVDMLDVRFR